MEDAIPVHVVYGLHELVNIVFDTVLGKVVRSPLDRFVHIHLHQLKHQSKSSCCLVVQDLKQIDDMGMWGQALQSLDLSQLLDLF